jgi:hypothetical protein
MVDLRRTWLAVALLCLTGLARSDVPDQAHVSAEAKLLTELAPAATRRDLHLQLRAANGQTVHFDSVHAGDDHPEDYVDFRLTGTSRDGRFFVVYARSYEGESTFWVSRKTGQKIETFDNPKVSPDGHYAVTALHSEAFGPSGVFVWEIAGDQLLPRAHLEHGSYGLFTFKRWLGNDRAELELYSQSYLKFCPGAQSTTATVNLVRGAQGWALAAPASARDVRCE